MNLYVQSRTSPGTDGERRTANGGWNSILSIHSLITHRPFLFHPLTATFKGVIPWSHPLSSPPRGDVAPLRTMHSHQFGHPPLIELDIAPSPLS